jgi:hypothetical protein
MATELTENIVADIEKILTFFYLFFLGGGRVILPSGPGPHHFRCFYITHNDTTQSVGLLWTSDQPDANTST